MKKKAKRELIICLLIALICIPTVLWLKTREREKKDFVDKTGIETIGTVIKTAYGKDPGVPGLNYSVSFDFLYEENYYTRFGFSIMGDDYVQAIVGRKYKVKFLPESPIITAQIYLNEPVYSEDVNIEKEQERILKTYK